MKNEDRSMCLGGGGGGQGGRIHATEKDHYYDIKQSNLRFTVDLVTY